MPGYKDKGIFEKGYQPSTPAKEPPVGDPIPEGGYQPTGTGENPGNDPAPPGKE